MRINSACWEIFLCFCCRLLTIFSKLTFSLNSFKNNIRVSNGLKADQHRHSVDLDPNCLLRLSTDDKVATSKERFKYLLVIRLTISSSPIGLPSFKAALFTRHLAAKADRKCRSQRACDRGATCRRLILFATIATIIPLLVWLPTSLQSVVIHLAIIFSLQSVRGKFGVINQ